MSILATLPRQLPLYCHKLLVCHLTRILMENLYNTTFSTECCSNRKNSSIFIKVNTRVKPQLFSSMKLEAILITDDLVREGGGNGVALWKYKELQLSCQGVAGIAVGITQYRGIITYRLVFTRTSANIENKAEQLIC